MAAAITNLNEHQAIVVRHDQVDFTETALKILCDQNQAPTPQELKSEALGAEPYSSRISSNQGASSAISGSKRSGSSLTSCMGPPVSSTSGTETGWPL